MVDTTQLKNELLENVSAAQNMKALEDVRVAALGKKGKITELMKSLSLLSVEEKKEMGKQLNILKTEINYCLILNEKLQDFLLITLHVCYVVLQKY